MNNMKRYLSNKIYLREKLFTLRMKANKTLSKNLDDYKKITSTFKVLDEMIGDENEAFILLNSIHETYKELNIL